MRRGPLVQPEGSISELGSHVNELYTIVSKRLKNETDISKVAEYEAEFL